MADEPPFISADDPRYTDVEHTDNLPRYRRGRQPHQIADREDGPPLGGSAPPGSHHSLQEPCKEWQP